MAISLYQLCWYFAIYSFLGWVAEVIFHAVTQGEVVNRGFLNGPVCPIYGFGMVTILYLAEAFLPGGAAGCSLLILLPAGILFATLIELFTGWLLEKLFHARWWDYRERPFNFKGYICLEFCLIWGIAVVLAVRVLHPLVLSLIGMFVNDRFGGVLLGVIAVIYITDTVLTVSMIIGITRELKALETLSNGIRSVSDTLSEVVGEASLKGTVKVQENMVQAALAKAELKDAVSSARSELSDAASNAKTGIKDVASSAKSGIVDAASSAKSGIVDAASSAKSGISDAASSAKSDLIEVKSALTEKMKNTGEDLSDRMHSSQEEWNDRIRELQNDLAEKRENYNRRFRRFHKRMKFRILGTGRMFAAYPRLHFEHYEELVKKLSLSLREDEEKKEETAAK